MGGCLNRLPVRRTSSGGGISVESKMLPLKQENQDLSTGMLGSGLLLQSDAVR